MSSATVPSLRITKSALRAFSSIGICASIFPSLSRREAGLTSLPPGAAAPRAGRPLEAVLALQLLDGDATGGLVPSPRAVDQVNEVRVMAQGEGLKVQTATDRHHCRDGLPTTCEYPSLLGGLPAVLRERGFRDLHCLHGLMSFPPTVIRSRTLIPTATMTTTGSGFSRRHSTPADLPPAALPGSNEHPPVRVHPLALPCLHRRLMGELASDPVEKCGSVPCRERGEVLARRVGESDPVGHPRGSYPSCASVLVRFASRLLHILSRAGTGATCSAAFHQDQTRAGRARAATLTCPAFKSEQAPRRFLDLDA